MTVHLRIKGWLTAGAVVPCSPEAMADLVEHGRAQEAELERTRPCVAALDALLKALSTGETDSDAFRDAYRAGLLARQGAV